MPRTKKEDHVENVSDKSKDVDKLLEALEAAKKEAAEAKSALEAKETAEKKVKDPMSGPGKMCECTKITKSEAWMLKIMEGVGPSGTEEMILQPVPEGYESLEGPNNTWFVVRPGSKEVIPNCRSKYTQEYEVYTHKPAADRGNFDKEPPKMKVSLCEKHQKMFDAFEVGGKGHSYA